MQVGSAGEHSLDAAATVTKVFDESDRSWHAGAPDTGCVARPRPAHRRRPLRSWAV